MRAISFTEKTLSLLMKEPNREEAPYLSLYVPSEAHWRLTRQRIQRRLDEAKKLLLTKVRPREASRRIDVIRHWAHTVLPHVERSEGLAIFQNAQGQNTAIRLPAPVEELCVVASSYHLKPLIRLRSTAPNYLVIIASAGRLEAFERAGDSLRRIYHLKKPSDGRTRSSECRQFLENSVTQLGRVLESHPIKQAVLYTPADLAKKVCQLVQDEGITVFHQGSIAKDPSEVISSADRAFQEKRRRDRAVWQPLVESARAEGSFITCIDAIDDAIRRRQIKTLLLSGNKLLWGNFADVATRFHAEQRDATDDCVLDDWSEAVIRAGGKVGFVDETLAPFQGPAAAILK